MKRGLAFVSVLFVALCALYLTERRPQSFTVSPNAVLAMAADLQRDVARGPMRLTRLSDQEEIRIGNELAAHYSVPSDMLSTPERGLENYLRRVGSTVSRRAHRNLPYSFHLLPNRSLINAFSLPGGHVYVGEGLLDLMSSEDQLAFILGHEIEHIDHYHCAERVQVEVRLRKLKLGAVGSLLQLPIEVWEAGYSKNEELEADREGMRLAVIAGYSPYGAVTLFQTFDKLQAEYVIHAKTPEQELSQLAVQSLAGYFRSHPLTSERLAQAEGLIAQERWRDLKTEKPFHVEYQVRNGEFVDH